MPQPHARNRFGMGTLARCTYGGIGFSAEQVAVLIDSVLQDRELFRHADPAGIDLDSKHSEKHPVTQLPKETQQSLLALLKQLLPPRTGDVSSVAFNNHGPMETGFLIFPPGVVSQFRPGSIVLRLDQASWNSEQWCLVRRARKNGEFFIGKPSWILDFRIYHCRTPVGQVSFDTKHAFRVTCEGSNGR